MSQTSALHRTLPLLLLLFVGSGCAALIYEVVWFQLLQFVIGSTAVSLAVLLGTFMGGMCLGSVALPRLIGVRRHPLRVYALLEVGIGLVGVVILTGLPNVDRYYATVASPGAWGVIPRAVIAICFLLPPTLLMGATLPAVARWVELTPRGVSWLGFFYGGNIVGAVLGCLFAGFYLLRVFDVAIATYVAATINVAVALIAWAVAGIAPYAPPKIARTNSNTSKSISDWTIYIAIALSGLSALGAEVIWTRLLSLIIGGSVYTFAIILAAFLIGLGIGSSIGGVIARGSQARTALVACQLLVAVAVGWAAYQLSRSIPYWPIDPALSRSYWHNFQLDILRCLWAVLPAAILWGASFPLALAAIAAPGQDPGKLVGGVYAANTVGAIGGAVIFSIFLVAWLGTHRCQQLLIVIPTLSAVIAAAPLLWSREHATRKTLARGLSLAAIVVLILWATTLVPETPGELIAHGRFSALWAGQYQIEYKGEGMNSSVAVSMRNGRRGFHVSGKVEASSSEDDMRLQRMLGHLPALMHPRPKSVLVVGCGAGVTAGSFTIHPDVERIVVCEIEPLIPKVVARFFAQENHGLVDDWRVEIVYDDARHYILTSDEKFDIITSDPIHPWVKGAATLYTREYFELCKNRLKPGGIISQWVPLYESNTEAVKSELATFFDVFPHGTVWGNDAQGQGYDVVLIGQETPLRIDVDALTERLDRDNHALVKRALGEVGFTSAAKLLATYAGNTRQLSPWLEDAELNRDHNLRLQYLAGLGAYRYDEAAIYREMLRYRRYPNDLFIASPDAELELKLELSTTEVQP